MCSQKMRWHFPIMRAMGGREGITAFPGSAADRDWHFPLRSKKCTCVTPSELLQPCAHIVVHMCVAKGSGFFLAADVEEVIHLVTAIAKSPCVCTFLCKCDTCVCSGEKTSQRERKWVCVCNGKMREKKHDLWKGLELESSGYSNACKSW